MTNALGTPDQAITRYAYDGAGNLVEQFDANQENATPPKPTRFEYDKLGRRTKRTLPGSGPSGPLEEIITYEIVNKRLHKTVEDFRDERVLYRHDIRERLREKGLAVAPPATFTPIVSYAYGPNGQRSEMIDALGRAKYFYDAQNRLQRKEIEEKVGEDQYNNMDGLIYSRDAGGNVTGIGFGFTENVITYRWDKLNRLVSVTNTLSSLGQLSGGNFYPFPTTYTYDEVGNLRTNEQPNGIASAYSYDDLNRLTDLTVTKGTEPRASYTYAFATGAIVQV